jgi:hypothetical protein
MRSVSGRCVCSANVASRRRSKVAVVSRFQAQSVAEAWLIGGSAVVDAGSGSTPCSVSGSNRPDVTLIGAPGR